MVLWSETAEKNIELVHVLDRRCNSRNGLLSWSSNTKPWHVASNSWCNLFSPLDSSCHKSFTITINHKIILHWSFMHNLHWQSVKNRSIMAIHCRGELRDSISNDQAPSHRSTAVVYDRIALWHAIWHNKWGFSDIQY